MTPAGDSTGEYAANTQAGGPDLERWAIPTSPAPPMPLRASRSISRAAGGVDSRSGPSSASGGWSPTESARERGMSAGQRVCRCQGGYLSAMADLIRGVLFDVDGTLVDSNYLNTVAWWRLSPRLVTTSRCREFTVHRHGLGPAAWRAPARGPGTRRPTMTSSRRMLRCTRCTGARLRPLPGAADLLRACHGHGLRVILASSAGPAGAGGACARPGRRRRGRRGYLGGTWTRASRRPTWCRSRFRKLAPARKARCSSATRSGTCRLRRAGVPCVGLLSGGTSEASSARPAPSGSSPDQRSCWRHSRQPPRIADATWADRSIRLSVASAAPLRQRWWHSSSPRRCCLGTVRESADGRPGCRRPGRR